MQRVGDKDDEEDEVEEEGEQRNIADCLDCQLRASCSRARLDLTTGSQHF